MVTSFLSTSRSPRLYLLDYHGTYLNWLWRLFLCLPHLELGMATVALCDLRITFRHTLLCVALHMSTGYGGGIVLVRYEEYIVGILFTLISAFLRRLHTSTLQSSTGVPVRFKEYIVGIPFPVLSPHLCHRHLLEHRVTSDQWLSRSSLAPRGVQITLLSLTKP